MIATINTGTHSTAQGPVVDVTSYGCIVTIDAGGVLVTGHPVGRMTKPQPADMTRPGDTIHET